MLSLVADESKASTSTASDHESTTSATQEDASGASDNVQSSYNPDHVTQSMLQVLAQVIVYSYFMLQQAIVQNIFPEVQVPTWQ